MTLNLKMLATLDASVLERGTTPPHSPCVIPDSIRDLLISRALGTITSTSKPSDVITGLDPVIHAVSWRRRTYLSSALCRPKQMLCDFPFLTGSTILTRDTLKELRISGAVL